MGNVLGFLTDKKKIHQVLFLIPILTFYLTNPSIWFFIASLVLLAIMEVYKTDLEGKIRIIINNRVKQKARNKPLLRKWKDQINDAGKEFDYIYSWKFFGVISLVFIMEFIYSTIISYDYSKILFGVHLFMIVYILFLNLIINYNFKLLASKKLNKMKDRR